MHIFTLFFMMLGKIKIYWNRGTRYLKPLTPIKEGTEMVSKVVAYSKLSKITILAMRWKIYLRMTEMIWVKI